MSTKLNDISSELKEITDRVEATEQRVAEVEESHAEHAEMITYTLELQKSIQAQLTDLEARSRRNNIRIRGIAEGSEGDNMKTFLEQFLKDELSLTETPLGIQRCHRSLGPRPPQDSNPRNTREKKSIHLHQKSSQEKGIRFQMLYPAKFRVFFDTGPVIYNSVEETTDDLRKRGLIPDGHGAAPSTRSKQTSWETAGPKSRRQQEIRLKHIQDKLKGFRRNEESS
ncbi:hypothetical protein D5F01_LYC05713 [Larimichthys crocea]|uniref:LINE-1 type transposase domain-containing protein 1 n=1 Tax=Larimichthys crocea TaxID=215358 RepID=A0A6G0IU81_LARCR|nr:hypothetical protein D5F01_LYC05713 [Larimichthys crocea]